MINAEKLLGSLLRGGLRSGRRRRRRSRRKSSGLGRLVGGSMLGMGVLGIAVAAFEHFTQKTSNSSGSAPAAPSTAGPAYGGASAAAPPPPPPPPPPGPSVSTPPPPPASTVPSPSEAVLLVQAMVAAANADGEIDELELQSIHERIAEAGLSAEEQTFLDQQLTAPPTLEHILSQVKNPRFGVQIYAVSLAAIEVDTDAERRYLEQLRSGLNLPSEVVQHLHEEFGIEN